MVFFSNRCLLDGVEPGPGGARFDVADPQVDGRVEVGERLGNRLDALVEGPGLDVGGLGGCEIAGLDRVGQFLHRDQQEGDLVVDIGAVVDGCLVEQRGQIGGLRSGLTGDGERLALGARPGAEDLVGPAVEPGGEGAVETGGEVLPLADDALVGDQLDLGDTRARRRW